MLSSSSARAIASQVQSASRQISRSSSAASSLEVAKPIAHDGAEVNMSSCSRTFEELYMKYATNFMKDFICKAEGDEKVIVSAGPHLSGGMDLFQCIRSTRAFIASLTLSTNLILCQNQAQ